MASESLAGAFDLAFMVDSREYLSGPVNGIAVHYLDDIRVRPCDRYIVAIGDPASRKAIDRRLLDAGFQPMSLLHPSTIMSSFVSIGVGSVVCAGCILTTNIEIGEHVHINLGCTVGHDARIGAYSTLSPGVHVSGNVSIGTGVFVGTGAVLINGSSDQPLVIGDNAVIAAAACVTRDVPPRTMVAGVPALVRKELKV